MIVRCKCNYENRNQARYCACCGRGFVFDRGQLVGTYPNRLETLMARAKQGILSELDRECLKVEFASNNGN